MSLLTHLSVQRKQIAKVAIYSLEAFLLCLVGTWLFAGETSLVTKLLISGAFALIVFSIGTCGVLFVSLNVLSKRKDNGEKAKGG